MCMLTAATKYNYYTFVDGESLGTDAYIKCLTCASLLQKLLVCMYTVIT